MYLGTFREWVEANLEPLVVVFEDSWRTGEVVKEQKKADVVHTLQEGRGSRTQGITEQST